MCPFEINGFVKSLGIQLFVNGIFKIDWPRILFGILILPRKRRQCMANQHHVDNVSQVQTVSKRIGIVSQVQTVSKRIGIVSVTVTVTVTCADSQQTYRYGHGLSQVEKEDEACLRYF